MAGRVEGKVALVTGGGSGIGRATALTLAREGAVVFVTDSRQETAAETAAMIEDAGGSARSMAQDVTDEGQWQAVFASLRENEQRLDILFNNAGVSNNGVLLADTTLEHWRKVNAVNVEGVYLGTKYGIELMAETGGGSIVNVSSIYGLVGAVGSVAYNASKGAVCLMTKGAALECGKAQNGVRVNSVHPGFIETGMTAARFADNTARDYMIGRTPIGRPGQPQDIANGVLFLASDESSFMTGAEMVIDGGFTAI
ncbi:MAG TPA: glucose 1-dehydrogenase [Alphaproteobacteria bacterium]|nr:glucose 1-dehydrogenase [Alphaproteobacteria bacterium]